MLLMYLFPMGASSPSMSMSMSSSSHAILDPGIGLLLAFLFFGSAIFTLASPNKGASHHGTHSFAPAHALVTVGADGEQPATGETAHDARSGFGETIASPRFEDLSHVVMCLGMGFMLILML